MNQYDTVKFLLDQSLLCRANARTAIRHARDVVASLDAHLPGTDEYFYDLSVIQTDLNTAISWLGEQLQP